MMKRIVIDHTERGTKTALLHGGKLIELLSDCEGEASLAGNIYAGIVKSILPSGFVFLDIGLPKNAFLYLNDSREAGLSVKQSQSLLVQVLKDPSGTKGAYVTSKLSLAGRYCVVEKLPDGKGASIGVSKKIADEAERERLKNAFRAMPLDACDVIVRTNAAGVDEQTLQTEFLGLYKIFEKSRGEWTHMRAPCLVYAEGDALKKSVATLLSAEVDEVVINDMAALELLKAEFDGVRFVYHDSGIPIMDAFAVMGQAEKALNERVWLKSGGFIVIQQTEACVVIDVNTGKYAGKKSHEETMLNVNLEAAAEIAYQLRLRNLGGIIIVDFIDMKDTANIELLINILENETKKDRLTVNVIGVTELGLMQMTRKKVRRPLCGGDLSRGV